MRIFGGASQLRLFAMIASNRNIKQIGVLPIWKAKSNVSSVGSSLYFLTDGLEEPTCTLETIDFTFHIGSTPYFDLYFDTGYAPQYVYDVQ